MKWYAEMKMTLDHAPLDDDILTALLMPCTRSSRTTSMCRTPIWVRLWPTVSIWRSTSSGAAHRDGYRKPLQHCR